MSKDYGYFGSGLDGYVHYTQAFNESFGSNEDGADDDSWDDSPGGEPEDECDIPDAYKASPVMSQYRKSSAGTSARGKSDGKNGKEKGTVELVLFIAITIAVMIFEIIG